VKNRCPGRIIRKGYPLFFLHVSFSDTRTVYQGLRGFQGYICHGVKRALSFGIPELTIARCRKNIYPLRAPGSRWPGEKKGRFKGIWRKSTRNLLKTRNRPKIEAEISTWLHDLKALSVIPLGLGRSFQEILSQDLRRGKQNKGEKTRSMPNKTLTVNICKLSGKGL